MTIMMVLMTACSSEDDALTTGMNKSVSANANTGAKTVLIYMAGRNNLSNALMDDLREVKAGSRNLRDNENLIVFVRNNDDKTPWVARIKNGAVTDSVSLDDLGIRSSDGQNRASDPEVMEGVMHYAYSHYPATCGNYGLVIEGHGSGWLMEQEVKRASSRAAAIDVADGERFCDGRWINVPTMASILKRMPHLKFIMTDCCNMMCLETLYELRSVCDYMIGSPAEIPDQGAPYDQILTDMFAEGRFYSGIISKYGNATKGWLPLTAVKTSEMENVARATRTALRAIKEKSGNGYPDMKGIIHYYHLDSDNTFHPEYNIFYDAGDYLRTFAPADAYQQWNQALGRAIVDQRKSVRWATDKRWNEKYADFTATEEKMHGVSMFVPQDPSRGNYAQFNEDIKKMAWYAATN